MDPLDVAHVVKQPDDGFRVAERSACDHRGLGHSFSFSALCRVSVGLNDVLLGPHPFLPQCPPKIALLCSSGSSIVWCGPTPPERTHPPSGFAPSRTGLVPFRPRRSRGLPVLVHVVSQRAMIRPFTLLRPLAKRRRVSALVTPLGTGQTIWNTVSAFSRHSQATPRTGK
jgi:hypothetical protein